jgi:nucleoside-diphosphate-sugar epimerase
MRLLVIGGTRFSGRALSELALEEGHELTLFHRGGGEDPFPEAEHLHGDRERDIDALKGRSFDAVVDMCGFVPRSVRASADVLSGAGSYLFVSSISAHRDDARPHAGEKDDVHQSPFPDTEEVDDETYGPLKVACERAVQDVFGERAIVVRPGLIVGPNDPTDRFTYWVRRVAEGGEVLAPSPAGYPIQWIDARDLGGFMLHLSRRAIGGVYNVVVPPGTATLEDLLASAHDTSGSDAAFTWVPKDFLDAHGVEEWSDIPLWIPGLPNLHLFDTSRAVSVGLATRSLVDTVRDTLAWDRSREQTWPMDAGLAPDRERELLAAWHARN